RARVPVPPVPRRAPWREARRRAVWGRGGLSWVRWFPWLSPFATLEYRGLVWNIRGGRRQAFSTPDLCVKPLRQRKTPAGSRRGSSPNKGQLRLAAEVAGEADEVRNRAVEIGLLRVGDLRTDLELVDRGPDHVELCEPEVRAAGQVEVGVGDVLRTERRAEGRRELLVVRGQHRPLAETPEGVDVGSVVADQ